MHNCHFITHVSLSAIIKETF